MRGSVPIFILFLSSVGSLSWADKPMLIKEPMVSIDVPAHVEGSLSKEDDATDVALDEGQEASEAPGFTEIDTLEDLEAPDSTDTQTQSQTSDSSVLTDTETSEFDEMKDDTKHAKNTTTPSQPEPTLPM